MSEDIVDTRSDMGHGCFRSRTPRRMRGHHGYIRNGFWVPA